MTELDLTKLSRPLESYRYAILIKRRNLGYCVKVYYGVESDPQFDYLAMSLRYKDAKNLVREFDRVLTAHKAMLK